MTDFTEADVTAEVERAAWDAWNKAPDTPGRMARAIAAATNAMRDRWRKEALVDAADRLSYTQCPTWVVDYLLEVTSDE